ncbi:hypothetical protein, partial [Megasphaera sp.]|uniref:hypothetical protein n=1 Tax=Megasphaera sp. TaxID=2023260 RepID=UPI003A8E0FE7
SFGDIPFFPWHKNQLLLMPKSITFFSRGKTPIYVNYVIAHNTRGAPVGYGDDFSRKLIGKAHIFWSGIAAAIPYNSRD